MYAEVVDGINLIWDNKFEEAEEVFSAKSANYPRHALHHAEVNFMCLCYLCVVDNVCSRLLFCDHLLQPTRVIQKQL